MKRILLASSLLLAACGPVYRTNYELFPPASKEGQLCVANVKMMSDTCVENCRQMSRSCRNPGVSIGYGYGFGRGRGSYETVMGTSLMDDRDCNDSQCISNCLAAARQSHVNCGGTMREEVVCTANCPKPAPQQSPQ